jgi:hypothetical protein
MFKYKYILFIYFTNIISSSNQLSNEQLILILQTLQFSHLHSLQIKEKKIYFNEFQQKYLTNYNYVLRNVVSPQNSLEIFLCLLIIL